MDRFRDDDRERYLWPMSERVLVACPRCQGQGTVLREGPRFACGRCGHAQRGGSGGYAGMAKASVNRKCGWCGQRISRIDRRPGPHPAKVGVCCAACKHWNYVPVSWTPDPQGEA